MLHAAFFLVTLMPKKGIVSMTLIDASLSFLGMFSFLKTIFLFPKHLPSPHRLLCLSLLTLRMSLTPQSAPLLPLLLLPLSATLPLPLKHPLTHPLPLLVALLRPSDPPLTCMTFTLVQLSRLGPLLHLTQHWFAPQVLLIPFITFSPMMVYRSLIRPSPLPSPSRWNLNLFCRL